jgi:hypothetical protein
MVEVAVQEVGVSEKRRGSWGFQEMRTEPDAKVSQRALVLSEGVGCDGGEE